MDEENIFQAYFRLNNKLIFMVSCYDIDYAIQYVKNLNNKTFKKYFKVFKSNNTKEFNDIYNKIDNKIMIFVTQLPDVDQYTFNFIKDIFHIHLAIPNWSKKDTYNRYLDDIQKVPIQKFINVKDKTKIYDNDVEDKLFNTMIMLVDKKLNKESNEKEFPRMAHTGGKLFILGERELHE